MSTNAPPGVQDLPADFAEVPGKLLDPGGGSGGLDGMDEGDFEWVAVAGCAGFRRVWKEAFCDDGTRCYYKEAPPSLQLDVPKGYITATQM